MRTIFALIFLFCTSTANAAFRVEIIGISGFPPGGTTGQVLAKGSNTDYDQDWVDIADVGAVMTTGTQSIAGAKTFSTSVETPNLKFTVQASDPGSPVEGQFYFNSTSHVLKFYNGTTWKTVTTN